MGRENAALSRPSPGPSLAALGQVLGLAETDLEFYRAVLGRGALPLAELAALAGLPELDAADRLRRLLAAGMVTGTATDPVRYRARHPETVFGERLVPMQTALAKARAAAAELAALAGSRTGESALEWVVGADRIGDRIADLADEAQVGVAVLALPELPLLCPQATRPGLQVRTIWPDRPDVVETLMPPPRGPRPAGTVRAASAPPPCGLLLVDDRVALVVSEPAEPAAEAVVHRHPGTVAAFVALFEMVWRSARPVWPPPDPACGEELTEPERALLGMLHLGLTDAAVANRLAVSVRTVGRRLEELMARLDARTRFQAGVEAARRGWV